MNPGTFQGAGTGTAIGTVSKYVQTSPITSTRTISVPPGTQRIEALICGGGGAGGSTGGGFGGMGVFLIPVTGQPLVVTIGAGGTWSGGAGTRGSPTYITSANTVYALIGGGAGGMGGNTSTYFPGPGGGGTGGYNQDIGSPGGAAPVGQLLWSSSNPNGLTNLRWKTVWLAGGGGQNVSISGYGSGGNGGEPSAQDYDPGTQVTTVYANLQPQYGQLGGGNGGHSYYYQPYQTTNQTALPGTGAGFAQNASAGSGGGGCGSTYYGATGGGSMTSVSVWGLTGFAAGGAGTGGGGGGGMLSAGSGQTGGNGGGGGGAQVSAASGGTGGNGFAVIRFYL